MGFINYFNILNNLCASIGYKEVYCVSPPPGWHKANFDGSTRGALGIDVCGGVLWKRRAFVRGLFIVPLGRQLPLYTEMLGFIPL